MESLKEHRSFRQDKEHTLATHKLIESAVDPGRTTRIDAGLSATEPFFGILKKTPIFPALKLPFVQMALQTENNYF